MANAVDKLTRSMSRSGCTSGAGGGDALPEPDEKGAAAQKVAVPRKERPAAAAADVGTPSRSNATFKPLERCVSVQTNL